VSVPSKPYVVRSGDYLTALAFARGTTVDDILADPNNADFKKQREHPEILLPGDIVYLPEPDRKWLPATVGSTNNFTVKVPEVDVKVTLSGPDGKALANKSVTTVPPLGTAPLTTDGSGGLTLHVPVFLDVVRITVDGGGPVFDVKVGNLDPHDEPSGLISRLRQLGHIGHESAHAQARQWLADDAEGLHQLALQRGIEAFQASKGQDVTGVADDALCKDVRDDHGS
jgi:hypothetical protein